MAARGDPYRRNGGNGYDRRSGDMDETRAYRFNYQDDAVSGSDPNLTYDYYDDGDYDTEGVYPGYYEDDDQDDYYEDSYYEPPAPRAPSMAARAAGKANTEIYGRPPQNRSPQRRSNSGARPQTRQRYSDYDYDDEYVPPRKRRKKRHPFRKFLTFLIIMALIIGAGYYMLFQAPEQWNDGYHTRKAGLYNIMICATDEEELRTDTIMIATLDQKNGTVSLTSVPRDTIVANGEAVPKINGVYGLAGGGAAGAEAMLEEMQEILGFRPDGYVVINYEIFRDVVDAMGGVTFDVPMDMEVSNPDGGALEIAAGEQLLDGETALGVCRYRYGYLMADIQRQYVQQSFLKALIQQLMAPEKLTKLPAVYSAAMDHVITNLSGANIRYLALHALLSGIGDIQQNTLPGEGVDYNGASCFGLYGQSVVDMVNATMNPFEEEITLDDVYILTVSGGTLVESTWSGTPFDASQYQYD